MFGETGRAFFDVWSIIHLAFWLVVGANVQVMRRRRGFKLKPSVLIVGSVVTWALACAWELFEWLVVEAHGIAAHPEIWFNRWISDPLVAVVGVLLGMLLIRGE